ncbi:glycosyltransferase involved in cell wall biosynthesis [Salirhabdus euzebyi]|uniref:Glycosyltransferase involved in cell wall biosynthesis n=1 Tax=Salirhabdus euzebyi TaxID=394506 RepID=A0A841Q879_9BACI|nr:glycosyltransferase family 4 protein [Salirhabdus euzebyi]MBB6454533.1 glycosyltransferase involved in cell wall biosynthesis [Salirhabdus euzebyi]
MNVLILSQAIDRKYLRIICDSLPKKSKITLITGSEINEIHNVEIIKSPMHNPKSIVSRIQSWLSFNMFLNKWIKRGGNNKFDLIFATSNPPINSYIGYKIKKRFSIPFIYMNWDIYPQIIEENFEAKIVKVICKLWHLVNNRIYKKIDRMITIGDVMAKSINKHLKSPIDISVIPIPANTKQLMPVEKNKNLFIKEQQLIDKFVVLYSGKMGYGHNIPLILEAAEKLKEISDIQFVFIGNGPGYKIVQDHMKNVDSQNIKLYGLQPLDIFPYSMASGDIGIVSQENKLAHLFMPSKTYDMMSCGLPIVGICSGNDDLSNLIIEHGVGEYVSSNDPNDLARTIRKLYEDKELLENYKKNAREVAVEEYSFEKIKEKYGVLFEGIGKGEK